MESGSIPIADLKGPFDLQSTVESGQSYLWSRADGRMYDQQPCYGGDHWYETVVPPLSGITTQQEVVRARQVDGELQWESTTDAVPILTRLLRLDDDLDAILAATADEEILRQAYGAYRGMRLVRDPAVPCLISFICSAQMRVSRIHEMQQRLATAYGETIEVEGRRYHAFPRAEELTAATEDELRELNLGYRAPYVKRTAEMIATEAAHPKRAREMEYEAARKYLTQFVGVGQKVADCVALFSLGFLQAVPLDTWIRTAIADHFPDCDRGGYAETSRALRERLGWKYAGYAQTYLFHFLRTGGVDGA